VNGTVNGIANGNANGIANGNANGIANGIVNGTGNGTANGIANGIANGNANGIANGIANGNANGTANGNVNGIANGNANGTVLTTCRVRIRWATQHRPGKLFVVLAQPCVCDRTAHRRNDRTRRPYDRFGCGQTGVAVTRSNSGLEQRPVSTLGRQADLDPLLRVRFHLRRLCVGHFLDALAGLALVRAFGKFVTPQSSHVSTAGGIVDVSERLAVSLVGRGTIQPMKGANLLDEIQATVLLVEVSQDGAVVRVTKRIQAQTDGREAGVVRRLHHWATFNCR
jgi:hypothetical protein